MRLLLHQRVISCCVACNAITALYIVCSSWDCWDMMSSCNWHNLQFQEWCSLWAVSFSTEFSTAVRFGRF